MKYNPVIIYFFIAFKFAESDIDSYISGGEYAKRGQYPHAVYLSISCRYKKLCGGSILNQFIVLSAGHCMDHCSKAGIEKAEIRYGHEDFHKMKIAYLNQYVRHENYNENLLTNDISMISTSLPILLNKDVKRVIIMRIPPVVDYAYVSGWGNDEHGNSVHKLKHTNARIQPARICAVMANLPSGTFCAGPISGLGTVKMGDSGSAVVVKGFIQIGLVSFGVERYSLAAYTNVSYHLDWIKKNAKRLYCAGKRDELEQPAKSEFNSRGEVSGRLI